jgi:hypothetical protein
LDSCLALLEGYWKAAGKFLKGIGKPLGNAQITTVIQGEDRIAQRLLEKTWQFSSLFYEAKHICLQLLKVAGAVENFKNAQQFFSCFCSFQPYHF